MNALESRREEFTCAGDCWPIARDVAAVRLSIVNAYFVGMPNAGDRGWVLVDTGLSTSAGRIRRAARERYGPTRPAAIVLTHGHFDHVGSVRTLAAEWDCPVFAHPLELPYLTGRSDYPPPDPAAGGGLMTLLSPLFSRAGINLGDRVRPLPDDGHVPGMAGWRWLHTPGHTSGHVSLFRDADRMLLAGDAFVTTRQESMVDALFQPKVVHGPPAYFTSDWVLAAESVRRLAGVLPDVVGTGHGRPMRGARVRRLLDDLAANFETVAVPAAGRYVRHPATADRRGVTFVPPPVTPPAALFAAVAGAAAVGFVVGRGTR